MTPNTTPYSRSAAVYDPLYESMKSYSNEASHVLELACDITGQDRPSLLDVACGTGQHLSRLAAWCSHVVGVDKSSEQLEVARKRLPDSVPLYQMDMCDLSELEGSFDVVTCLFSSIGYMPTVESLHLAIAEMASKLNPGGALIVEPWLTPETYTVGSLHGDNVTNLPNLRISRMNIAEIIEEPGLPPRSFMEMHYLVGRPSGIERFREEHVLTLFTTEQYLEAISAAGLEARFDPDGLSDNGRGVFIGIKPT